MFCDSLDEVLSLLDWINFLAFEAFYHILPSILSDFSYLDICCLFEC